MGRQFAVTTIAVLTVITQMALAAGGGKGARGREDTTVNPEAKREMENRARGQGAGDVAGSMRSENKTEKRGAKLSDADQKIVNGLPDQERSSAMDFFTALTVSNAARSDMTTVKLNLQSSFSGDITLANLTQADMNVGLDAMTAIKGSYASAFGSKSTWEKDQAKMLKSVVESFVNSARNNEAQVAALIAIKDTFKLTTLAEVVAKAKEIRDACK